MTTFKSYIGSKDFKWWDGITRTFTRLISTGSTLTLNKLGYYVDVLEAYGTGTTYSAATINLAINAIASNQCMVMLQPGTWTIDADVTGPANITLFVPHGADIAIATGKTFTWNGPIMAGSYQIFSGAGTLAGSPILALKDAAWINGTVTDSTTSIYKNQTAGTLATDTINEKTANVGVTIDGSLIKDGAIKVDTVSENTLAAGVTVDGVKLKDSQVYTDTINEKTAGAGVTVDGLLIKDGGAKSLSMEGETSAKGTSAGAVSISITATSGDRIFVGAFIVLAHTLAPSSASLHIGPSAGSTIVGNDYVGNIFTPCEITANTILGSVSFIFQATSTGIITFTLGTDITGGIISTYNKQVYAFFLKKQ